MPIGDYQYPWQLKRRMRPLVRTLRYWGVGPDDAFLASYPRSGSTWLRFLLTELHTGQDAQWTDVDRVVPDVGRHRSAPRLLPGGGRMIKTHDRRSRPAGRAVYLVRDGRDVLLSEYRSRVRAGTPETLDEFVRMAITGDPSLFGPWPEHVRFWLGCELADQDRLLVVRFEDLRSDTVSVLSGILSFLGWVFPAARIDEAVEHNSLQQMRRKEERALDRQITRHGAERFVGQGVVGAWAEKLTAEQIASIDRWAGPALERLGYPTGTPG
jgi:hypothetical protein